MSDSARELASDIGRYLRNKDGLVKQAAQKEAQLLRKIASFEQDNKILSDTLELVSQGAIDPLDALDRVEEFRQDPHQIEVIKAAFEMGMDQVPTLGEPVASDNRSSNKGDVLSQVLSDLAPTLDKRKW